MPKVKKRVCQDCGDDISHLYHNTVRCKNCSARRKKIKDSLRLKKKRLEQLRWTYFIEDPDTGDLTHRNAKGSKLRYWVDKICKQLSTQELEIILNFWDRRTKDPSVSHELKEEYRTCAGMVRDWKDYLILKEKLDMMSFDSTSGVMYRSDGSYYTVDFDEENGGYIVRDNEGTVIYEITS